MLQRVRRLSRLDHRHGQRLFYSTRRNHSQRNTVRGDDSNRNNQLIGRCDSQSSKRRNLDDHGFVAVFPVFDFDFLDNRHRCLRRHLHATSWLLAEDGISLRDRVLGATSEHVVLFRYVRLINRDHGNNQLLG